MLLETLLHLMKIEKPVLRGRTSPLGSSSPVHFQLEDWLIDMYLSVHLVENIGCQDPHLFSLKDISRTSGKVVYSLVLERYLSVCIKLLSQVFGMNHGHMAELIGSQTPMWVLF